jgi:small subunit ribosomal protein S15
MTDEDYSEDEIETLVVKLHDEGHQPSVIGMKLRDMYGIPDVKAATGQSITSIIEEQGEGMDLPEDLRNLVLKAARLREHLEENENDATAIQGLQKTEDKIRSLAEYHRDADNLDEDWTYDPETVNILLE